ncbi:MAG: hypothetical protein PHN42_05390 [Bacilli bacterium]|nr:hypothetical protein [Bacilli bacterium]
MSKLYDEYLIKKQDNNKKLYIFKNGNFYILLGEDAKIISEELNLKLTNFCNESKKCGFPVTELDKYTKFISLLGYEYEIVLDEINKIINDILNIDINTIDGNKAIEKLLYYKNLLLNKL